MSTLPSLRYRRLVPLLSLAALGGLLPGAAPAPEPTGFVWEAPGECPRRVVVLQQLADVLGSASVASAESILARGRARGSIRRDGERWVLDLEVRDETGSKRRHLESERCADLAHAAALVLALLLEKAAAGKDDSQGFDLSAAGTARAPRPAAMQLVGEW